MCVLFYSTVGVATAFSTSLTMLLILRALYGIGMGGEWGLGASLAMEKIPPAKRGFYSGVLQQGYPVVAGLAGQAIPSKIRVITIGSTGSISEARIERSSGQPASSSRAPARSAS